MEVAETVVVRLGQMDLLALEDLEQLGVMEAMEDVEVVEAGMEVAVVDALALEVVEALVMSTHHQQPLNIHLVVC